MIKGFMGVKDGDKIMKKILSALIISALVFSAAGCGSSGAGAPEAIQESAAEGGNTSAANSDTSDGASETEDEADGDLIAVASSSSDAESESNTSNDASTKMRSTTQMAALGSSNVIVSSSLDKAVGEAILEYNEGSYLEGECVAEGHIILDVARESSNLKVYVLTMYGEYSFINDMFIKVSGSGVIPVVMNFQEGRNDEYELLNYQVPQDGSKYVTSIKELFPQSLYSRIVPGLDADKSTLMSNERKYAKKYLESIGRTAEIGNYSDLDLQYPNVSDEIKSTVFDRYWEYPDWLGTTEKIEDGVRYVYETQWKNYGNDDSMIYLTKYVYDTGEIIRTINVHIDNGVIQSSEEKVLRLIENSAKQ